MHWKNIVMKNFFNLRNHSKSEPESDLKEVRKNEINFQDIFSDFQKSKEIYKELIRKCHPDRFVDSDLNKIATDLSLRIAEHKSSYSELCHLREEACEKLNITI